MDKVLVKLYVPMIEEIYDVWLPSHKKIGNIICLLVKAINDLNVGCYRPNKMPVLYNKLTAEVYPIELNVKETNIRSGIELILL